MKFVLPNIEYREKAAEFLREFYEHKSPINGTGGLDRFMEEGTYTQWLEKIANDADIANIGADRVPAYTYFYVRTADERLIGMINIRLALNDFLKKEGGHIGYCIRPTERGKGYATRMLGETLAFCGAMGLHDIIITCGKENTPSARVIQNNGGTLEAEFYSETFSEVVQRYRIDNHNTF